MRDSLASDRLELPDRPEHVVHGPDQIGSPRLHVVSARYEIGGRLFCDCSCGDTTELFTDVRPYCFTASVDEDFAAEVEHAREVLARAAEVRERRMRLARREARLAGAAVRRLMGRTV